MPAEQTASLFATFVPLIFLILIFYFFIIRPQKKRQREVQEMQDALKKGDKVVTVGGMHGVIHALDEGTVIIRTNDGVKLTYDRTAIRDVLNS